VELLDVLIHGWTPDRHVPQGDPAYDWLAPYLVPADEWPRLWRTHQALILREAKRRGVAVPYIAECVENDPC